MGKRVAAEFVSVSGLITCSWSDSDFQNPIQPFTENAVALFDVIEREPMREQ